MSRLLDILEQARDIEPIAVRNGVKIYSMDDARAVMQANALEGEDALPMMTRNPDGSIARSRHNIAIISENDLYDNRCFRKKTPGQGSDEFWVVPTATTSGYRAIRQKMNDEQIYVYVITRDKDTQELSLKRVTTVSASDFKSDFTHKLDEKSMKQILPLIADQEEGITPEEISI